MVSSRIRSSAASASAFEPIGVSSIRSLTSEMSWTGVVARVRLEGFNPWRGARHSTEQAHGRYSSFALRERGEQKGDKSDGHRRRFCQGAKRTY